MIDLLDINVWLALIDKRHVHHMAASRYGRIDRFKVVRFVASRPTGFCAYAPSPVWCQTR